MKTTTRTARNTNRCRYGTDNLELRGGSALSPTGANATTIVRPTTREEFMAFFAMHSAVVMVTDHGGNALIERRNARAVADYYFGPA